LAGFAVPLILGVLIFLAIASWRVVHPPLAMGFSAIVGFFSFCYVVFSVVPNIIAAADTPPDVAAAPFEATARDARPNDMAVQIYRGAQLLGECALGSSSAAPVRSTEPLRVERVPSGKGFQVWSGATLLGDLPATALAGLEPASAPAPQKPVRKDSAPPQFFLTGKVPVGGTAWLGQLSPAGPVSVQFVRLNEVGLAVVKVNAPDLGPADPPTLELNNKAALTQSFERMDFDVAIREASFIADPPWASFAVMAHP
jgi:hypothetical protein